LIIKGLTGQLEQGRAYAQWDKAKILGYIANDCQEDGDDAARLKIALVNANAALHAYFAIAAWPFAVQNKLVLDFDGPGGEDLSLIRFLKSDVMRRQLIFSLAHFEEVGNSDVEDVTNALPPNLWDLRLGFEGCVRITDAGLNKLKDGLFNLPTSLKTLHLSFMGCRDVSDDGIVALAQELPRLKELRDFKLDCSMCSDVTMASVDVISQKLPKDVKTCVVLLRGTTVNRDFKTPAELRRAAGRHKLGTRMFAWSR